MPNLPCQLGPPQPAQDPEQIVRKIGHAGIELQRTAQHVLEAFEDNAAGRRDRAIVELLYGAGLRVGELVALDLDPQLHELLQDLGVGGQGVLGSLPVARRAVMTASCSGEVRT